MLKTSSTYLVCRYVDDIFSIIPKGNHDTMLQYLNSIDPHIKFTIEQPNAEGGIPFLDTFPKPQGEDIVVAVYRKPTHTDRYLDFNSSHPVSAKRAVVRAVMDRAENVCSDPEILAKEIDHLSKVLHYNYPQWMINQRGKLEETRSTNSSWNREWDTETFLHLSTLFPRIKWIFQENLQVHTSTKCVSKESTPWNPCWCTQRTRSPVTKRRI